VARPAGFLADAVDDSEPDEWFWYRFPKRLVEAGFAQDYPTAAAADIYDAAVFLFLDQDVQSFTRRFLLGK